MNKTTILTPAFVKKLHKAHTTTTRFHWRLVGTNRTTTKSVHFILKNMPKLLKDWTKLYRRSNNGTFKNFAKKHANGTRTFRNKRSTHNHTTSFTRRHARTSFSKRNHRTNAARNRFAKNAKRTNKNRFTTHGKRFANRKRNYRTRRAA
jgi:hypothetical protein